MKHGSKQTLTKEDDMLNATISATDLVPASLVMMGLMVVMQAIFSLRY